MNSPRRFNLTRLFVFLVSAAALSGLGIPAFYEWTESDQSRISPWLAGFALGTTVVCLALRWLPIGEGAAAGFSKANSRFGIRALLTATSVIAAAMASWLANPLATSYAVLTIAIAFWVRFLVGTPEMRAAGIAFLGCLYAPYAWVFTSADLERLFPELLGIVLAFPAFLPGACLSGLLGQHVGESPAPMNSLAAGQLFLSLWMIQRGPKPTLAMMLISLQLSLMGSLAFHMLYRA